MGVSVIVGEISVSVGGGVGVSEGVEVDVAVISRVKVGGGVVAVNEGRDVSVGEAVAVQVGVGVIRPAGFPARRTSARPVQ